VPRASCFREMADGGRRTADSGQRTADSGRWTVDGSHGKGYLPVVHSRALLWRTLRCSSVGMLVRSSCCSLPLPHAIVTWRSRGVVPTSDASADLRFLSSLPHFALPFFVSIINVAHLPFLNNTSCIIKAVLERANANKCELWNRGSC